MTNWVIALNIYLEEQMLPDCLRCIRSTIPEARIIVIDGAYESWVKSVKMEAARNLEAGYHQVGMGLLNFINPESIDRSHEICKEFKVDVLELPPKDANGNYVPWKSEAVKRNEFFKYGKDGEYWLWIDADEMVQGHPEDPVDDVYNIMLKRDDPINPYQVQRVFKHKNNLNIKGAHHGVHYGDTLIKKEDPDRKILNGITLYHLWCKRNELNRFRHMAKGSYYRNGLLPEEAEFRAINNI